MKKIVLILTIFLFVSIVTANDPRLYEHYDTGDDNAGSAYGLYMQGQNFTIGETGAAENFIINNISLKMYRVGNPGNINITVVGVDANGNPNQTDVKTWGLFDANTITTDTSGSWYNITVDAITFTMLAHEEYSFIINNSDGNSLNYVAFRQDETAPTYLSGHLQYSEDGGGTWLDDYFSRDMLFRIWEVPSLDTITINLSSPINNTALSDVGANFTIFYNATGRGTTNFTNATYYVYYDNGTIFNNSVFYLLGGNNNVTTEYIDDFVLGNYLWGVSYCYVNLTQSYCVNSTNNTLTVGASIVDINYSTTTYETAQDTFTLNISLIPGANLYAAKVFYNGTEYQSEFSSTGNYNYYLTKDIDINLLNEKIFTEDKEFYWQMIYSKIGGTFFTQTLPTYTQHVNAINLSLSNKRDNNNTLNFSAYDEINLTKVNDWNFFGTFEYWLGSGNVKKNMSITNYSNIDVYLNLNYDNLTFFSDGIVQYEKTGFVKRSYYLVNNTLTNTTSSIKLILLDDTLDTSVILEVLDNVQFPITDAYIYIQKYYPGTGTFETVEIAKTDDTGSTIGHFETETEDYRFIIIKNNEILYTSPVQKIVCESTPCKLTFQTTSAFTSEWQGFGVLPNFIWSLTFNSTTNIYTYIYVDTSGTTHQGRLWVYKENLDKKPTTICNVTSTSSSATLICDISNYNGTINANAYIMRSPETLVYSISTILNTLKDIFSNQGLFFALFIILILGMAGLWNPAIGIILIISGIIIINLIGLASFGAVTIWGIILIGAILLWQLKT